MRIMKMIIFSPFWNRSSCCGNKGKCLQTQWGVERCPHAYRETWAMSSTPPDRCQKNTTVVRFSFCIKGAKYGLQCYHKHFRCHNGCSNSLDGCLGYIIYPAVMTFSTEALSYVATRIYLWQPHLCHAQATTQYRHLCFKIVIYFSESAE